MSNQRIYRDHRSITRAQLATELRRIAEQLETGHDLGYGGLGAPGHIAVPERVDRELDISYSANRGWFTVGVEFSWAADAFADRTRRRSLEVAS
ncbi:hypothetical protein [Nocardia pseudobrasiliensis]|uniref:Uncharacterized protein n=1 Tax=Nocardia pseudobrasiliensis TaxID=45979 RepID=A0A370HQ48_9NOCA|nr:hypothetical protein [Nocardia pseudobrasiliensis]RDI60450.1 hypothetical protein DFR76_11580 [Nocardia pseudobrasiliensis]